MNYFFSKIINSNHKQNGFKLHPTRTTSTLSCRSLVSLLHYCCELRVLYQRGTWHEIFFRHQLNSFQKLTLQIERRHVNRGRVKGSDDYCTQREGDRRDDQRRPPRVKAQRDLPLRSLASVGHGMALQAARETFPWHKSDCCGSRAVVLRTAPGPGSRAAQRWARVMRPRLVIQPLRDCSPDGGAGRVGTHTTGISGGLCPRSSQRTTRPH